MPRRNSMGSSGRMKSNCIEKISAVADQIYCLRKRRRTLKASTDDDMEENSLQEGRIMAIKAGTRKKKPKKKIVAGRKKRDKKQTRRQYNKQREIQAKDTVMSRMLLPDAFDEDDPGIF